jgi:uncharacterized protein YciI
MDNRFFIQCFVNESKLDFIIAERSKHLKYIDSCRSSITYAGIVESSENPYQQIIYFLEAKNKKEALDFIKEDPYYPSFEEVLISPFSQKILKGEM